ncbi:MAG: thiolase family protein [Myxococcaceae bacterium]|nr:thiolase family protein [Myxococcaceae bacterium]
MPNGSSVSGFVSSEQGTGAVFDGVYVLEGKRTPFGKFCGALSSVSPTDLGISASKAVLEAVKAKPTDVDQVIVSNIGQASADCLFLPRHIGLYSGVPLNVPALMVQRICGSGIEVIGVAAEQIGLGKANLVLGTGTETMSRFPLASFGARQGFPLGKPDFVDMLWASLDDTAAVPMGVTADNLAAEVGVTRDEVDRFAFQSQERYAKALEAGFFAGEIVPVSNGMHEAPELKARRVKLQGVDTLAQDEHPRRTTLEKLAKLPFVFSKDGPTTAGSASGIVDGACAVLIAGEGYVQKSGQKPLGKVKAIASVGCQPRIMGFGPVPAIRSVLKAAKLSLKDIDLFEINEAFGAQALSVAKTLELDQAKLNVHGGAIAIGHPLGATGTRLVTTLLKALKARGGRYGVASACIGGGQGIAMVVEAL